MFGVRSTTSVPNTSTTQQTFEFKSDSFVMIYEGWEECTKFDVMQDFAALSLSAQKAFIAYEAFRMNNHLDGFKSILAEGKRMKAGEAPLRASVSTPAILVPEDPSTYHHPLPILFGNRNTLFLMIYEGWEQIDQGQDTPLTKKICAIFNAYKDDNNINGFFNLVAEGRRIKNREPLLGAHIFY